MHRNVHCCTAPNHARARFSLESSFKPTSTNHAANWRHPSAVHLYSRPPIHFGRRRMEARTGAALCGASRYAPRAVPAPVCSCARPPRWVSAQTQHARHLARLTAAPAHKMPCSPLCRPVCPAVQPRRCRIQPCCDPRAPRAARAGPLRRLAVLAPRECWRRLAAGCDRRGRGCCRRDPRSVSFSPPPLHPGPACRAAQGGQGRGTEDMRAAKSEALASSGTLPGLSMPSRHGVGTTPIPA